MFRALKVCSLQTPIRDRSELDVLENHLVILKEVCHMSFDIKADFEKAEEAGEMDRKAVSPSTPEKESSREGGNVDFPN